MNAEPNSVNPSLHLIIVKHLLTNHLKYSISMIDGEEVIRSSQIHVGCLYLPLIIMGIGLMIGVLTMALLDLL